MLKNKIRKAVIPVAGLGTRFLPITSAVAKEMLPIVDKPVIELILREAVESGIEEIILVNSHTKKSLEAYLISYLKNQNIKIKISSVIQEEALGLGHAVLCARDLVGESEPFAVMLGDDVIRNKKCPAIKQLINKFNKSKNSQVSQVALMRVPKQEIRLYGAAVCDKSENLEDYNIKSLVEKPEPEEAQTDLAVVGRYVFSSAIWPLLEAQGKGKGNEIQLTDAMAKLDKLQGCLFEGQRIDAGDKLGFLHLNLVEALERPELKEGLLKVMRELVG